MVQQILRWGWIAVEAALILVVLCVLLGLILGSEGGTFITSVAANTTRFLQAIPPGTFLGVVLVVVLYWIYKSRISGR